MGPGEAIFTMSGDTNEVYHNSQTLNPSVSLPPGDFDASTPTDHVQSRSEVTPSSPVDLFTPGVSDALTHFRGQIDFTQDSVSFFPRNSEPLSPLGLYLQQFGGRLDLTDYQGTNVTPVAPFNTPAETNRVWNLSDITQPDFSADQTNVTSFVLTTEEATLNVSTKDVITPKEPEEEKQFNNPTEPEQEKQFNNPGDALIWVRKELVLLRAQDKDLHEKFTNLYKGIQDLKKSRSSAGNNSTGKVCDSSVDSAYNSTSRHLTTRSNTTLSTIKETEVSPGEKQANRAPPLPPRSTTDLKSVESVCSRVPSKTWKNPINMNPQNVQLRPLPAVPVPFTAWAVPTCKSALQSTNARKIHKSKKDTSKITKKAFTSKLKKQLLNTCFHSSATNKGKAAFSRVFGNVLGKNQKKNDSATDNKENINPNKGVCKKSKQNSRGLNCIPTGDATPGATVPKQKTLTISAPIPIQACPDDAVNIYMNGTMVRRAECIKYRQEKEIFLKKSGSMQDLHHTRPKGRSTSAVPVTQTLTKQILHKVNSDNALQEARKEQLRRESMVFQKQGAANNNMLSERHISRTKIILEMPKEEEKPKTRLVRIEKQRFPERETAPPHDWTQSSLSMFSPMSMELSDNYYSMSDDEELRQWRPRKFYRQSNRVLNHYGRHRRRHRALSPLAESVELGSSYYSLSDSESTFYTSDLARKKNMHSRRYRRQSKRTRNPAYLSHRNIMAAYRSRSKLSIVESDSSMSQFPTEEFKKPRERRPLREVKCENRSQESKINVFEERFSKATKTKTSKPHLDTWYQQQEKLQNRRRSYQGQEIVKKDKRTKYHRHVSHAEKENQYMIDRSDIQQKQIRTWRRETSASREQSNQSAFCKQGNSNCDIYQGLYSTDEWVV